MFGFRIQTTRTITGQENAFTAWSRLSGLTKCPTKFGSKLYQSVHFTEVLDFR